MEGVCKENRSQIDAALKMSSLLNESVMVLKKLSLWLATKSSFS